jgi:phenylpropionate dioxygenase-like ring-hydroxylating dioxygenase large terminal subunit
MLNSDEIDAVDVPGRPSPSIRELLERDSRPVDPVLVEDRNDCLADGPQGLDTRQYFSREFQQLENEQLWSRVWQIACREEQIPNVGDYVLYEAAGKSLIITRAAPEEIRAYYNACLHRGRALCEKDGRGINFRCKFHGWVYSLQGKLIAVPSEWDFPNVKQGEYRLPQAKVGRWGGFVFINMDPDSISLQEYIKDIPEHFARWHYEDRHLVGHVGQVVRANWKVAAEAFLENYHVMATHPQVLPFVGDANSQYTVRNDRPHYSRLIFALGVASPHIAAHTTAEQVRTGLLTSQTRQGEYDIAWPLAEGKTVRDSAAEGKRAGLRALNLDGVEAYSDSELLDGWVYSLFPNFTLWGGAANICYRFRPWGDDPEMSLLEIMLLPRLPKGAPRPPAAKMTLLGPEQTLLDSPELGEGGAFFNQDLYNMAWVQKGMRSLRVPMTYARYQESPIRHFHKTLNRYIAGGRPA